MSARLQLTQDGPGGGAGDICHVRKVFVTDIDLNRLAFARTGEAAIPEAEQNGDEALAMVAYHQVVESSHRATEMVDRQKTKKTPCSRVSPNDFVDLLQRQM